MESSNGIRLTAVLRWITYAHIWDIEQLLQARTFFIGNRTNISAGLVLINKKLTPIVRIRQHQTTCDIPLPTWNTLKNALITSAPKLLTECFGVINSQDVTEITQKLACIYTNGEISQQEIDVVDLVFEEADQDTHIGISRNEFRHLLSTIEMVDCHLQSSVALSKTMDTYFNKAAKILATRTILTPRGLLHDVATKMSQSHLLDMYDEALGSDQKFAKLKIKELAHEMHMSNPSMLPESAIRIRDQWIEDERERMRGRLQQQSTD